MKGIGQAKLEKEKWRDLLIKAEQIPEDELIEEDDLYQEQLMEKIGEEVKEYAATHSKEEIKDMLDLLCAFRKTKNSKMEYADDDSQS